MDLVYIVRRGNANEELRHSLRSLDHLDHDRVWIVGHKPRWVTGVHHIPGNRFPTAIQATYDNLRLAATHPDITDRFVVMNDDFFVMRPTDVPVWWRSSLDDHLERIGPTDTWWRRSLLNARQWLADRGIDRPLSYELHTPFTVDKAVFAEVLDAAAGFDRDYPPQWRTIYGNVAEIGGIQAVADCKIPGGGTWPESLPFLSTSDESFRHGQIGQHIRDRFPDPCRYERS